MKRRLILYFVVTLILLKKKGKAQTVYSCGTACDAQQSCVNENKTLASDENTLADLLGNLPINACDGYRETNIVFWLSSDTSRCNGNRRAWDHTNKVLDSRRGWNTLYFFCIAADSMTTSPTIATTGAVATTGDEITATQKTTAAAFTETTSDPTTPSEAADASTVMPTVPVESTSEFPSSSSIGTGTPTPSTTTVDDVGKSSSHSTMAPDSMTTYPTIANTGAVATTGDKTTAVQKTTAAVVTETTSDPTNPSEAPDASTVMSTGPVQSTSEFPTSSSVGTVSKTSAGVVSTADETTATVVQTTIALEVTHTSVDSSEVTSSAVSVPGAATTAPDTTALQTQGELTTGSVVSTKPQESTSAELHRTSSKETNPLTQNPTQSTDADALQSRTTMGGVTKSLPKTTIAPGAQTSSHVTSPVRKIATSIVPEQPTGRPSEDAMNKLLKDFLNSGGDTTELLRKYESNIAMKFAAFPSGTTFSTSLADFSVQKLNLQHPARQSRSLPGKTMKLPLPGERSTSSHINVPLDAISDVLQAMGVGHGEINIVLAQWRAVHTFPAPENLEELPINGTVLTVSYFLEENVGVKAVVLPVTYTVDLRRDFTEIYGLSRYEKLDFVQTRCVWLNLTTGKWSGDGCQTMSTTDASVVCECQHTTTFTVLLNVHKTVTIPEQIHEVSFWLEMISVVFLTMTIAFLIAARHGVGIDPSQSPNGVGTRTNRTNSQVSLCVSMLSMHVCVLCSDTARYNSDDACLAVTALTHFFLLSTAFWSLNEGIGLCVKMLPCMTMAVQYKRLTCSQILMGWCVPFVISSGCFLYGFAANEYMDIANAYVTFQEKKSYLENGSQFTTIPKYEQCWLKKELAWAAFVPFLVVVLVNTFILIYITGTVVRMKRKIHTYRSEAPQSRNDTGNMRRIGVSPPNSELPSVSSVSSGRSLALDISTKQKKLVKGVVSGTRSFAILMPILSIPWALAIFANIPELSTVLLSAHALINPLQGLLIFILYCLMSKTERERVLRKLKRTKAVRLFGRYRMRPNVTTTMTRVSARKAMQPHANGGETWSKYNVVLLNSSPIRERFKQAVLPTMPESASKC